MQQPCQTIRADSVSATARQLFQAGGDGSQPISALHLRFVRLDIEKAVALVALWHSSLPTLNAKVSAWEAFGAQADGLYVAAAVWGSPVARLLAVEADALELRRFAISSDAPRNTASRMLGWMTRELGRIRPEVRRLISYHDHTTHRGTIYRAAGWTPVPLTTSGGRVWQRGTARRILRKTRWEKAINESAKTNK